MSHTSETHALSAELSALLRLTRAEAQIARIRVNQARDESFRRELLDNAEEADLRALRLQEELRRLGGTPDVVGDAVGRVVALTKATAEQLQPFSEGLLGDLALEHQLRDRAVFTRVLAQAQDRPTVASLMDDLEGAHTETIEWLNVRLAEFAQGGPVAIQPTPPQALFSALARAATLPARQYATLVNRTIDALRRGGSKVQDSTASAVDAVRERTESAADAVRETAEATGEVVEAGRDAALARTEEVAPSRRLRRAARETREDLGTVDAASLPVAGYDAQTQAAAIREVRALDSADDLQLVLRYEAAHKNRKPVLTAAEKRLTELAEDALQR